MTTCDGTKGKRSKAKVRLSVDTMFGYVVIHVWEGTDITHSFNASTEFMKAMRECIANDLRMRTDDK